MKNILDKQNKINLIIIIKFIFLFFSIEIKKIHKKIKLLNLIVKNNEIRFHDTQV